MQGGVRFAHFKHSIRFNSKRLALALILSLSKCFVFLSSASAINEPPSGYQTQYICNDWITSRDVEAVEIGIAGSTVYLKLSPLEFPQRARFIPASYLTSRVLVPTGQRVTVYNAGPYTLRVVSTLDQNSYGWVESNEDQRTPCRLETFKTE